MTTRIHQDDPRSIVTRSAPWPLERVLFALAGTVTLVAAVLAATISPWWLLLSAFAGVNQLAFAAFGDCVASLVLRRFLGLESRSAR